MPDRTSVEQVSLLRKLNPFYLWRILRRAERAMTADRVIISSQSDKLAKLYDLHKQADKIFRNTP